MKNSTATNIMNQILYGNREGLPSNKGKGTNEYDNFLKSVFNKEEEKYNCDNCKDTGFISKIEWYGTDDSYEVEKRCVDCNED